MCSVGSAWSVSCDLERISLISVSRSMSSKLILRSDVRLETSARTMHNVPTRRSTEARSRCWLHKELLSF